MKEPCGRFLALVTFDTLLLVTLNYLASRQVSSGNYLSVLKNTCQKQGKQYYTAETQLTRHTGYISLLLPRLPSCPANAFHISSAK